MKSMHFQSPRLESERAKLFFQILSLKINRITPRAAQQATLAGRGNVLRTTMDKQGGGCFRVPGMGGCPP